MLEVVGVGLMAMLINQNRLLQYLGRISLRVLCIHGPVYRVVVKIISIPLHMSTDAVRESFVGVIVVVITLAICSAAYEVIVRITPWMVGKRPSQENVRKRSVQGCLVLGSVIYWGKEMRPDSVATGNCGFCCSNNHTPLRGEQRATIL